MEGLQRSSSTFRRSGSSGLVWDERFLTSEDGGPDLLQRSRSTGGVGMMVRAGAGDDEKKVKKKEEGDDQQVFRTKDVAPDVDPPSPRVSGCILCAVFRGFGPATAARRGRTKPRKTKKQR